MPVNILGDFGPSQATKNRVELMEGPIIQRQQDAMKGLNQESHASPELPYLASDPEYLEHMEGYSDLENHNGSGHALSQDNTEPAQYILAINYTEEPRHRIRNKNNGQFVEDGVESPSLTPPGLGNSSSEADGVALMERRTMHAIQQRDQETVGTFRGGGEHSASIDQHPKNVYHTDQYLHEVFDGLPPVYPHQGNQFTHASGLRTFDHHYNGLIANVHPSASSCPPINHQQGLSTPSTVAHTHDQYALVNQAPNHQLHITTLQQPAAKSSGTIQITNQHSRTSGGPTHNTLR